MDRVPGVEIADAEAVEPLETAEEADAGSVRDGVEVAAQDDALALDLVHRARAGR
jgi:hypothetical protein